MGFISPCISSIMVTTLVIIFLYHFTVQHSDPYFHFLINSFTWVFEFSNSMHTNETNNIMMFGKKKTFLSIEQLFWFRHACDNFYIVKWCCNCGFFSHKISKQLSLIMQFPAKYNVFNLSERKRKRKKKKIKKDDGQELVGTATGLHWAGKVNAVNADGGKISGYATGL